MKTLTTIILTCAMLVTAQVSFARSGDSFRGHQDRGHHSYKPHQQPSYSNHKPRRAHRPPQHHARNYHRGEQLPHQYRGNQYHVNDWQRHNLQRPPRGYHWVQIDGDFLLIAAATGVIASILLAH